MEKTGADVVIYHNIVAPYRHAIFDALRNECDAEVWYALAKTADRLWKVERPSYPHRILNGTVSYAFGCQLLWSPGLLKNLAARSPKAVIAVTPRSTIVDLIRIASFARHTATRLIWWVGALEEECAYGGAAHRFARRTCDLLFTRLLTEADGYIYYSSRSRDWAQARGAKGPHVIGSQVLSPPPVTPRLELTDDRRQVRALFVGKLNERKGVDILVRALESLSVEMQGRVRLRLIGGGSFMRHLSDYGGSASIEALGWVPRDDLWNHYRDSDFLVVPSRHDPWPNVINEAMSVGTPVLLSKYSGGGELVARSGWIVDVCNPGDLAVALSNAIRSARDPARRRAALEDERVYRPQAFVEKVASLIDEVCKSGVGQ